MLKLLTGIRAASEFAGSSIQALEAVLVSPILESWATLLNKGKIELQAAVLTAFAITLENCYNKLSEPNEVLEVIISSESKSVDEVPAPSLSVLSKRLYDGLGRFTNRGLTSTSFCVKCSKEPIVEVKCAALHLLSAVARFAWGINTLFSTVGFASYINDWQTEFTREGRASKFLLMQNIVNNPSSALLNDDVIGRIRQFVSRGPSFVPARVQGPETMEN